MIPQFQKFLPRLMLIKAAVLCIGLCLAFFPRAAAEAKKAHAGSGASSVKSGEWHGSESGRTEHFIGIISDRASWRALWKEAFGSRAPHVDFRKRAVACVFLGHCPGWWYSINILKPRSSGSTIVVPYELVSRIVEVDGRIEGGNIDGCYGNRGQYRMKIVEKTPGVPMTMEMAGHPQVPPRFSP